MKVTILDTETGRTVENSDYDEHFWSEGNGSCDCNRSIISLGLEQADKIGEDGICKGAKRFLISKVEGALIPTCGFNDDYPAELVNKFLTPKQ